MSETTQEYRRIIHLITSSSTGEKRKRDYDYSTRGYVLRFRNDLPEGAAETAGRLCTGRVSRPAGDAPRRLPGRNHLAARIDRRGDDGGRSFSAEQYLLLSHGSVYARRVFSVAAGECSGKRRDTRSGPSDSGDPVSAAP